MKDFNEQKLAEMAIMARKNSYAPYSSFAVGAALFTKSGKIYTGCNIENAAFSPTNCAERTAVFKAVSEGEKAFYAIAIVGGKIGEVPSEFCYPCGVCRQVLSEFANEDLIVILVGKNGEISRYTLGEILPHSFKI